jgi:hypothetical protein
MPVFRPEETGFMREPAPSAGEIRGRSVGADVTLRFADPDLATAEELHYVMMLVVDLLGLEFGR